MAGPEMGTDRTTNLGMAGLRQLANGIVTEEQSIYSLREQTEEDKLFEINNSVRALIEGLEKKETSEQKNESETQQKAK
jgi:Pyruvate/2-oxoacid:ferredoxin oxidoreductase gamma subunit